MSPSPSSPLPTGERVRPSRAVALVTLGCARNEVDSEELAGRLEASGWALVDDPAAADAVLVNTCGFVESAKKDSIDTLLEAADLGEGAVGPKVVAVGCLAERYGDQLAASLPEADAVLGFDDYAVIGDRLDDVLAGRPLVPHTPRDRRTLLPLTPVDRQAAAVQVGLPGHGARPELTSRHPAAAGSAPLAPSLTAGPAEPAVPDLPSGLAPASGPRILRRRLDGGPVAPLKLSSGCDRRCTFCAIPRFRGSHVSRPPGDVLAEARWLAEQGVRELVLVSENSTSYGKDLGDLRLLEKLLPDLAAVDGVERVRVSYLQPAETRPSLIDVMTSTPGVVPYFDLSFQHASAPVLRRMRRFGDTERFLALLETVRERVPGAGARSNVIVGFPGETEADVAELERFLTLARLDAVGVFGYSDEDETEAATFPDKLDEAEVSARLDRVSRLAEELTAQRAEDRVGERIVVLVEQVGPDGAEGRADHQAPEVDGSVRLAAGAPGLAVGRLVPARVVASDGVDLVAEPLPTTTATADERAPVVGSAVGPRAAVPASPAATGRDALAAALVSAR